METFASFDGVDIAYGIDGAGPDVLLVHGFGSSHEQNWIAPGIAAAIVASGRRIIYYDARGHGASGKPHDVASYDDNAMVRDARALLDVVGVRSVDVVGYSMGALVSSRLVPEEPRSRSLVLGGIGKRIAAGDRSVARERIARALEGTLEDEHLAEKAFRRFAQRNGNDITALAAIQRSNTAGTAGRLDQIWVPTLVVAGEQDRLAGAPGGLAELIRGARSQGIPGDHLTAVAAPLATAIVAFLDDVSPV